MSNAKNLLATLTGKRKTYSGAMSSLPKEVTLRSESITTYAKVIQLITNFFIYNRYKVSTLRYAPPVCSWGTPFYKAEMYKELVITCTPYNNEQDDEYVIRVDASRGILSESVIDTIHNTLKQIYIELEGKVRERFTEPYYLWELGRDDKHIKQFKTMLMGVFEKVDSRFDETFQFISDCKIEQITEDSFKLLFDIHNTLSRELIRDNQITLTDVNKEGFEDELIEFFVGYITETLENTSVPLNYEEEIGAFMMLSKQQ